MKKLNLIDSLYYDIDHGVNVLYQKKSNLMQCSCFDSLHQTGRSDCNVCKGEGFLFKIEKVPAIMQKVHTSNKEMAKTSLGNITKGMYRFYLKNFFQPKLGEKIIICSWKHNLAIGFQMVLEVTTVDPIIDDKAGLIGYDIFTEISPSSNELGKAIVAKAGKKVLQNGDGYYVRPL